jgi:hypothetical protein
MTLSILGSLRVRPPVQIPAQTAHPFTGEQNVILFFAEDLHGLCAGGAKRGRERGGFGDDQDEQDDDQWESR